VPQAQEKRREVVVGAVTVTGLIASVPGTYKRCKKARSFKARRKEE
jgi:hypothetical protein